MIDITTYKIKDIYTGKLLRIRDEIELSEWLTKSYATLTEQQAKMIQCLGVSFEQDDPEGIKWYGVACGLEITPKKTRRKRS